MLSPEPMCHLTLVVLAAGIGRRYGGLKQMDPLGPGGEIMLEYSVHDALKAGFNRVVFVIRRSFQKEFETIIAERIRPCAETVCVCQELDILPRGFSVPEGREKPWGKKVSGEKRLALFNEATRQLPPQVPVNTILYHMEGDPAAASAFVMSPL